MTRVIFGWLLVCTVVCGCGQGGGDEDALAAPAPDAGPDTTPPVATLSVEEQLARYESGEWSLEELSEGLQPHTTSAWSGGAISGSTVLAGGVTYPFEKAVVVEGGGILVVLPHATLVLPADSTLEAFGRLYLLGRPLEPVTVKGAVLVESGPSELRHVALEVGATLLTVRNTPLPVRIIGSRFERWVDHALQFEQADGLRVTECTFGLEPENADYGEIINGKTSAVRIERCTFGKMVGYRDVMDIEQCKGEHIPVIAGNVFLGGEDDAIDLDDCDALVVNNLITGFRPPGGAPFKGVNGGGITGDRTSQPVLVGNVVMDCHHGIGFKNGAQPVLINNTVVDSTIGITLYTGDPSRPKPHGVFVNNLVWNNEHDLVLNGKWWPSYNQEDDVQATYEAWNNFFGQGLPGDPPGGDPVIERVDGIPMPSPGSPLIDAAVSSGLPVGPLSSTRVLDALSTDRLGTSRGAAWDIGALERP